MIKNTFIFVLMLGFISCGATNNEGIDESENTVEPNDENVTPYGDYLLHWQYIDDFTEEEEEKLQTWIETVVEANTRVLGQYPFDIWFSFHKSDNEDKPVTFGHTDRGEIQGVQFYVCADYSLEEFLENWTAPHEISHLSIPFCGKNNKWFSEGYATYLSRQTLIEMGYMTHAEFDSMYLSKIHGFMDAYCSTTKTHLEVSDSLLEHYNYPGMYWGSSSFFITADRQLTEKHDMHFIDVVKAYQENGRAEDESLKAVITSFDRIIDDSIFESLMKTYRNEPSGVTMVGY